MGKDYCFDDVPEARRRIMRRVKSKDTKPERILRSMLHAAGYRFRKHLRGVPGRPDVAFSARRKAIFVHGCFWHQHAGCRSGTIPRIRSDYWRPKLERNVARDKEKADALRSVGWDVFIIWECGLARDRAGALQDAASFLGEPAYETSRRVKANALLKS